MVSMVAVVCTLLASAVAARAVEPGEMLADPRLEERARALSAELRCLVCQNQSIDDSNAPLARDLRLLVRERLAAGDSDAGVRSFIVARYGEFVLLRPPFSSRTVLLWVTPLVILAVVAWLVVAAMRRRAVVTDMGAERLTREEEEKLQRILAAGDGASENG
ncbi:MAG: cytochrome c-type biogenesis protein [Pseudomonadota bacterium]